MRQVFPLSSGSLVVYYISVLCDKYRDSIIERPENIVTEEIC